MFVGVLISIIQLGVGGPALAAPQDKELVSIQIELIGRNDQYRVTKHTFCKQILSSVPNIQYAALTIRENSWAKVSGVKMRINGKSLGKEYYDIRSADGGDVFLADAFLHGLFFPTSELKVGDTISYEYSEAYADLTYVPLLPLYNINDIERYELTVKYPRGVIVSPSVIFVRDSFPVSITDDGRNELSVVITNISKADALPAYPLNAWHGLIRLDMQVNDKSLSAQKPREFMEWYGGRVSFDPTLDSTAASFVIDSIGASGSPREQLAAIHDWVRTHIRYVADFSEGHSLFPHSPSQVLARRYGDCKDRSYLVCALAKQIGLTVHMGLVASTFRPNLGDFISIGNFDHVICSYRDSSGEVFFDPTARYRAFDDLPSAILEHPALVLDPQDPHESVIGSNDTANDIDLVVSAHIDTLQTSPATITVRKDVLSALRYVRVEQTGKPLEDLYRDIIEDAVRPVKLRNFQVTQDSGRFMRLSATADLSALVVVTQSKVYFPGTIFPIIPPEVSQRERDSLPLYYDAQTAVRLELKLNGIPAKGIDTVAQWGDPRSGQSVTSISADSLGTVHYVHQVHRFQKVFAGREKADHLSFCARYVQERKPSFALLRGKK